MKLADYLDARKHLANEPYTAFSKRAQVPMSTLNRVRKGGSCNAKTQARIVKATRDRPAPCGGTVTYEDLAEATIAMDRAAS